MLNAFVTRYLPVLCLGLLALATWWLADQVRRNGEPQPANSASQPDFIVEGVRSSRLGPDGQIQTLMRAVALVHTPAGDVARFEKPEVYYVRDQAPPVTVTAERGASRNGNETIDLAGKVRVVRAADARGPAMTLVTEQLQLRPDDDAASSDVYFRVDRGSTVVEGIGMTANNAFRQVEVRARARGIAQPQQETP